MIHVGVQHLVKNQNYDGSVIVAEHRVNPEQRREYRVIAKH